MDGEGAGGGVLAPLARLSSRAVTERVHAAGGLIVRDGLVALVHRPRYRDWTLPKGKLDPGESFQQAALREVEEETGLRCRLVRELEPVSYPDARGRPKIVRYWLMEVVDDPGFTANDEVDELRWVAPAEAEELLSYPRDAAVLRSSAL